MSYQSVEVPEVITTDVYPWLVDNLWGFEFTSVADISVIVGDPHRNRTFERVQNIPNHSPNNERVPTSTRHDRSRRDSVHTSLLKIWLSFLSTRSIVCFVMSYEPQYEVFSTLFILESIASNSIVCWSHTCYRFQNN